MTEGETTQDPLADSPQVAELEEFGFPADEAFAERVRRSIHRREAASGFVDLSTRGFLRLLMDYLSTLLRLFHPDSGADHANKEP